MEKDAQGAGTRFLRSSKTDQAGEGAWAYLSPVTMAAIARWRDKANIRKGPLFRRVEPRFDGSVAPIGRVALHPNSNTLIYKRLSRAATAKQLLGELDNTELDQQMEAVSVYADRVRLGQDHSSAGEGL